MWSHLQWESLFRIFGNNPNVIHDNFEQLLYRNTQPPTHYKYGDVYLMLSLGVSVLVHHHVCQQHLMSILVKHLFLDFLTAPKHHNKVNGTGLHQ